MLGEFAIGQHVPGDSFLHRLDPRTKMGMVAGFVVLMFAVNTGWGYAAGAALLAGGVLASRLSPGWVLRSLKPVLVLVLLSVLFNAFGSPGEALWRWGPLTLTREGLERAVMVGARLLLLVASASLLTLTTSPIDLTDALERILAPARRLGVPAHELAMMMTIALRFIPTLIEEADRIMKAQMARGAAFGRGSPLERAKSLLPILVPLFVGAFRRADELALAMEARAYRGGVGRTRLRQLRMRPADYATLAGFAVVATAVGLWL